MDSQENNTIKQRARLLRLGPMLYAFSLRIRRLPYFDVFREFAAVAELALSRAAPASAGRACAERVPGPLFLYDISDYQRYYQSKDQGDNYRPDIIY